MDDCGTHAEASGPERPRASGLALAGYVMLLLCGLLFGQPFFFRDTLLFSGFRVTQCLLFQTALFFFGALLLCSLRFRLTSFFCQTLLFRGFRITAGLLFG